MSWSPEEYRNLHGLGHGYVSVHSALLGPTADAGTCVVLAAALGVTTVFVCVLLGIGTITLVVGRQGLRMPVDFGPSSLVKQYVPRISRWLYWGCYPGGQ